MRARFERGLEHGSNALREARMSCGKRSRTAGLGFLPRPSASRSRRSVSSVFGERPAVRSGGRAVHPEGEDQQSHGEADAAGRTREQAATEVGLGDPGIQVSEARTPPGQAECGVWGHPPFGPVNPSVNPSVNPKGNRSGTVRQIDVSAAPPLQSQARSGLRPLRDEAARTAKRTL